MKIIKFLFVLLLLAGAVLIVVTLHQKKTEAKKIEAETGSAASSAKDAVTDLVKAGSQTAGELATNAAGVATNVGTKIKGVATNVVNKVETVATNVADQAKQKFDSLTH
jgi:flagellar basal body-associated protein FliL